MTKRKTRVELHDDKQKHFHPILFMTTALMFLGLIGGAIYFRPGSAPHVAKSRLLSHQGHYSTIYASDGQVIWGQSHNHEINATQKEIDYRVRPALLSIEDRNFYHEHGINLMRTIQAIGRDIIHHNKAQGGSTLTEQLVKNSVFPASTTGKKSIKEKVKEIRLSQGVNQQFSKNQILQMYANKVYMGSGIYGMETASYFYFDKPMNKISVTQAALLAGMVQSPSNYDPYIHPKYALQRRNTVLSAMVANHKLSKYRSKSLRKEPLNKDLVPAKVKAQQAKQMYDHAILANDFLGGVFQQLNRRGINLNRSSYQIKTPLNMNIQKKLFDIVNYKRNIPWPNKRLNVAATVIDNKSGKPVAQIGGRGKRPIGAYDQAIMSDRSSGSAIKPILDYAPAMDDLGWNTGHTVYDDRYKYPGTKNNVYDWDNEYQGKLTLARALMNSRNIPAIKTLASVGLYRANKLARLAGIGTQKYYADAIGANVSTAQLASAYSAIANYGVRRGLTFIDKLGKSTRTKAIYNKPIQVMSPQTAYMLTKIMENIPTRHELGQDAIIHGIHQAGKTGSVGYANGNSGYSRSAVSDIWYVGYTKQYTIAIWTGYNNPKHSMTQKEANISEILYKDIMNYLVDQRGAKYSEWKAPNGMKSFRKGNLKQYKPKDADKVTSPSLREIR